MTKAGDDGPPPEEARRPRAARRGADKRQATPDYIDNPSAVRDRLRSIGRRLPEAYEEPSWAGTRWRIRKHTFAHVRTAATASGAVTLLDFRLSGPEFDAVVATGHPFFAGGNWGPEVVVMVIDADTDWPQVAELLEESYRLFAPKYLIERLDVAQG